MLQSLLKTRFLVPWDFREPAPQLTFSANAAMEATKPEAIGFELIGVRLPPRECAHHRIGIYENGSARSRLSGRPMSE